MEISLKKMRNFEFWSSTGRQNHNFLWNPEVCVFYISAYKDLSLGSLHAAKDLQKIQILDITAKNDDFSSFQNSGRSSARHTARAGVKPFGAVRSHQELHFDYLICGDLMHWSGPITKSNDPPLSVTLWTALF